MPDFSSIIENLRQLASTRGGKVIVAILLTLGAILAAIRYMLWSGTLDPLEGGWRVTHNFTVLLFFLMLALAIASILLPKPETKQNKEQVTVKSSRERGGNLLENDRIRKLARNILMVWIIVVVVLVYVMGWTVIWRTGISPLINQFTTGQFNWSEFISKDLVNFVAGFIIVTMWIIMPAMFYLEVSKKQTKAKRTKNTREGKERLQ